MPRKKKQELITRKNVTTAQIERLSKKALKNGVRKYLKGHVLKPVFRRFN